MANLIFCNHVDFRLAFAVQAWSHRIFWFHAICTTKTFLHAFSSMWALPIAEEYHWQSSIVLQACTAPYEIRGTALPGVKAVWKFFTGLRTFLCAATAGPPAGGYLVQGTPRHSCSQRSDDVDPVYWGLLYKLIWEDAERGKFVGPCSCTASVHSCQWRQAEWLDLHVSLNVVVLNSLYACFWVWCSGQTTVSYGKSFCGCFCLGSCPFLCVWFAVSFDETQVWLGDLRVVWLVCVMVGLLWFACISGPFRSLYKWRFYCLCSCKDRAIVRHRPYSRKKKGSQVPSKGSQVKVPKVPSRFPQGSQGSSRFPQGSQKVPTRFPQGSFKVPCKVPKTYPQGSFKVSSRFPEGSQVFQGSQGCIVKVPSRFPRLHCKRFSRIPRLYCQGFLKLSEVAL